MNNESFLPNDQKLPNAQKVLILGIVAIVGSCCCNGIIGIICGLIGLNLYKKDNALYQSSPNSYTDYNNLNTGRILCIIGLVVGVISLIWTIYFFASGGMDAYMEQMNEIMNAN
ncbi:MAG: CCC motif membrane protein [Cruoricaptor ignavus]|nr:CCC motif membrane protein [Cruoricaptor ignavus]